jgi:hypothetical protein
MLSIVLQFALSSRHTCPEKNSYDQIQRLLGDGLRVDRNRFPKKCPRIPVSSVSTPEDFFRKVVRIGQPVVLTDAWEHFGQIKKWADQSYLEVSVRPSIYFFKLSFVLGTVWKHTTFRSHV